MPAARRPFAGFSSARSARNTTSSFLPGSRTLASRARGSAYAGRTRGSFPHTSMPHRMVSLMAPAPSSATRAKDRFEVSSSLPAASFPYAFRSAYPQKFL